MADELTDQLFDILEDFIAENRALTLALSEALAHLPESAQVEIRRLVDSALSDSNVRAAVRRTVAQYKSQPLSRTLRELRKGTWRDEG